VNVAGTINVFEAAKRAGLKQVIYASSIAVYGPVTDYPAGPLPHDAPLKPRTHYGVYKQANEGAARIYYGDDGISSIGLRPYTIYGPGRDQGMTSGTTRAMLAAAAGQAYHIPYGGRCTYQYASDAADAFIAAARAPFDGAEVFNLPGSVAHITEVIAAIEAVEPVMQDKLTFENKSLPFPEESDDAPFKALLGQTPYTPLTQGVAETIGLFKAALADGRLAL
jgi:nucleoside-diphosphate-sugar epimerase